MSVDVVDTEFANVKEDSVDSSSKLPGDISATAEVCVFCLEAVKQREGGIPLFSPGCCGKWFHLNCTIEYLNATPNKVDSTCPSCRFPFEIPSCLRKTNSYNSNVPISPLSTSTISYGQVMMPYETIITINALLF